MLIYRRLDENCLESCLKYFFIQSIGSAIFIGILYLGKKEIRGVLILILRYKMGAAPIYFWFPSVCRGLRWISCFILMSFQKLLPLILLLVIYIGWLILFVIIIRLILGTFGSFNQSDFKQLIAYSSIHHLGWIILCNIYNDIVWFLYLIIYRFIIFSIIYIIKDRGILRFVLKIE